MKFETFFRTLLLPSPPAHHIFDTKAVLKVTISIDVSIFLAPEVHLLYYDDSRCNERMIAYSNFSTPLSFLYRMSVRLLTPTISETSE